MGCNIRLKYEELKIFNGIILVMKWTIKNNVIFYMEK